MKKLDAPWLSNIETISYKENNVTYFAHLIYNPNKPQISFEEAAEKGIEPNPTTMFFPKEILTKEDLPQGFELFKKIGKVVV